MNQSFSLMKYTMVLALAAGFGAGYAMGDDDPKCIKRSQYTGRCLKRAQPATSHTLIQAGGGGFYEKTSVKDMPGAFGDPDGLDYSQRDLGASLNVDAHHIRLGGEGDPASLYLDAEGTARYSWINGEAVATSSAGGSSGLEENFETTDFRGAASVGAALGSGPTKFLIAARGTGEHKDHKRSSIFDAESTKGSLGGVLGVAHDNGDTMLIMDAGLYKLLTREEFDADHDALKLETRGRIVGDKLWAQVGASQIWQKDESALLNYSPKRAINASLNAKVYRGLSLGVEGHFENQSYSPVSGPSQDAIININRGGVRVQGSVAF